MEMKDNGSISAQEEPHKQSDKHLNSHGVVKLGTDYNYKSEIIWRSVIIIIALHLSALYGLYLILTLQVKFLTIPWVVFLDIASATGVTVGVHRMFSHRSYKATFSLRLILVGFQTMTGQYSVYRWVRDHRLHHKFSDTDADPHNAKRGFFFSHMGWVMCRKHPLVIEKRKTINMSDMEADSLVMFQWKYYNILFLILGIVIPVLIPKYAWGETIWNSLLISFALRYVLVLNQTGLVNSAGHMWGAKPFDQYIAPGDNGFIAWATTGEGWHNYHHAFPWDYKTSEYGSRFNLTKRIIDMFAYFGMAYDLQVAPFEMIERRCIRTGDGSHPLYGAKKVKTYRWGEENGHYVKDMDFNENNIGTKHT